MRPSSVNHRNYSSRECPYVSELCMLGNGTGTARVSPCSHEKSNKQLRMGYWYLGEDGMAHGRWARNTGPEVVGREVGCGVQCFLKARVFVISVRDWRGMRSQQSMINIITQLSEEHMRGLHWWSEFQGRILIFASLWNLFPIVMMHLLLLWPKEKLFLKAWNNSCISMGIIGNKYLS